MNINEKRYPNISKTVAFRIAFTNVLCEYGMLDLMKSKRRFVLCVAILNK